MLAESSVVHQADINAVEWWRGAAIYQIYPRSFADSNGDGIGDLPGVAAKLDYVASLGVDGIWLSPFFTSPMHDFGYDVSEYCDVDPVFGTLADFDALVRRAHELGLKVIIDQVYSHSSIDHRWFTESRKGRADPKADWYVWADAKADGSPPTNWQSVFGGAAWTWDARRGQYYLHNFLAEQPDLNLHNSEVQDAMLRVARFWLDRDVDGFRIDAINFAMHDPELRDNPPAENGQKRTRPFDFQLHLYNQSHPGIAAFLERLRVVIDDYDGRFTMAEVGGEHALREMREFTAGNTRLNSAYGFDFLYADTLSGELICKAQKNWPDLPEAGWPTWAFENHDAPRAVSRWNDGTHRGEFLHMKAALLASLRGNIIVYQGEELGLDQVDVPLDKVRDPEALRNWPLTLSRDGARSPMPWTESAGGAGFTEVEPWLPIGETNRRFAVDRQDDDPDSILNVTRNLLALRNAHPALRYGRLADCRHDEDLLALEREHAGSRIACLFNLGAGTIALEASDTSGIIRFAVNDADSARLPPFGALLIERY